MTIKDIAGLAGVSISTVSKIINGKDEHINPATRSRVLEIVKTYNFTPYGMSKKLPGAKTFLIGILVRSLKNTSPILEGVLKAAQAHSYTLLLLESQDDPSLESKHMVSLCQKHVDGLLWEPISEESTLLRKEPESLSIPFLCINSKASLPACTIDYEKLGYLMTHELIERGHTVIAYLQDETSSRSAAFLSGLQKCLYENRIPFSDYLLFKADDSSYMPRILQYGVTAAISFHQATAFTLYKELERYNYNIPQDFSLICLKDMPDFPGVSHKISGIPVPFEAFGNYLGERLIQCCEKTADASVSRFFLSDAHLDHDQSLASPVHLKQKHFLSVGSIHTDLTFNVSTLPQLGSTLPIHKATTTVGGKGANQAMGIAKLGHSVNLIGSLGDDIDASFILNTLEEENVSTKGIQCSKKSPTGKAYIYTKNDGESAVTVLSGANNSLSESDITNNIQLFVNASYCLLSSEIPIATVIAASQCAKDHGAITVLKPSALETLPEDLYQTIDILIPNKEEAAILCPEYETVEKQADYFLSRGISTVIITLGHEGCLLRTCEKMVHYPAQSFKAVDTTGGADAFISALAVYLYEGYTLENAIQIALVAAGFCISRQGVSSALIDKNSLEIYLARMYPQLLTKNMV